MGVIAVASDVAKPSLVGSILAGFRSPMLAFVVGVEVLRLNQAHDSERKRSQLQTSLISFSLSLEMRILMKAMPL